MFRKFYKNNTKSDILAVSCQVEMAVLADTLCRSGKKNKN